MLAALAVFSLVALLASQSIASLSGNFARLRMEQSASAVTLEADTLLRRYVSSLNGAPVDLEPGAALYLSNVNGGHVLVLSDERGETQIALPAGDYRLASETDALGGVMLILRRLDQDRERVIALAPVFQNAAERCRFDTVGRRCLEP
jgi:hypothetical protein